MNTTAVYPGTFDPFTNGHLDIVKRARVMFSHVIVAVTHNPEKQSMFSVFERVSMIQQALSSLSNVTVEQFDGLLVTYVHKSHARIIVRGLRAISDFEYEFQMALMNRKLCGQIETVFLMPDEKYTYLSSSLVKEIARLGGDIAELVPRDIHEQIRMKK
ncbi:MAG: pantetheine-phosphate adenylyltransferase [Elusimicrobia bacterium]|nr:pantetheine-phosphate adenylyltransferase [Elusimicrobiota bacterium]MBD3412342.1 pantetheine-phosphate adenylyltransferase [Elusimicrobiota bacterium]